MFTGYASTTTCDITYCRDVARTFKGGGGRALWKRIIIRYVDWIEHSCIAIPVSDEVKMAWISISGGGHDISTSFLRRLRDLRLRNFVNFIARPCLQMSSSTSHNCYRFTGDLFSFSCSMYVDTCSMMFATVKLPSHFLLITLAVCLGLLSCSFEQS